MNDTPEVVNVPMDNVVDLIAVDAGEYKIRILQVNSGVDRNGNPYLMPRYEIPTEEYSKDFTDFIGLPGPSDDAKTINRKKLKYRDFCLAFGFNPAEEHVLSDFEGSETWAALGKRDNNDEYGEQNYVKKYIKPV